MNEIKKIAKSTVIYLFGSVGTKIITFFLLPILTSNIPEADFGIYNTSCSYATLISSVLFLDVWAGIMRFMFDYKSKKEQYQVIYSGIVLFVSSLALYIGAFFIFNAFSPMTYPWLVLLYGASLCFQNLYSYISRALGNNSLFAVSGIVSTLVNAGVTFVLVLLLNFDYSALYIAYVLGIFAQCIILEAKVRLFANFKSAGIKKELVRQILRFSLPLCINSACYWMLNGFNTIFVFAQLGSEQTGYYGMAGKFAVMISLVTSCFSMAWQELAFNKSDQSKETGAFYSTAVQLYAKALFCGYLLLMPFISIIFPFFIRGTYGPVKAIIPLYMLATIVSIMSTFLGNILTAYKRNQTIFVSTLCACTVNVVIAVLLIDLIGVQAASLAMLCGYFVCDFVRILFIKQSIPLRFGWKSLLYMIPLCVLFSVVYLYSSIWLDILMFVIAAAITLFLFKDYVRIAYAKLLSMMKRRHNRSE